ncbi:Scr1 family TA system antitoxin-like transcriptional regulator [Streptomyces sp. F63]|uniref:Scr1 family TA system antitoxin-like transcriptional regulator n=1 Tax=Streptomyces sp. F63 TaxID=2824887 RepID=UPI0035B1B399
MRVVPFETDGFTGSGFSMHYMEAAVRQLDTAQFDTVHGSVFVDDERELAGYRDVLDRVEKTALSESETRQFIHRLAGDL